MKTKVNQKVEQPFIPEEAFRQLMELYEKGKEIDFAIKKEAKKQIKKINKEGKRLLKLQIDYFKSQMKEFKSRKKGTKRKKV
jgi:hypothetical protein